MKKSVRIAAKAHSVALLGLLVCPVVGIVAGIIEYFLPNTNAFATIIGFLWPIIGLIFIVILTSGFHIAVTDALQRIERRDRSPDQDQ
jgi:di/tricarboxylate transporter